MKECIHKKGVKCFTEEEARSYMFSNGYPDKFKNEKEYIENIRERKKDGCKVCHFYKAGFKGSAQVYFYPYALAC